MKKKETLDQKTKKEYWKRLPLYRKIQYSLLDLIGIETIKGSAINEKMLNENPFFYGEATRGAINARRGELGTIGAAEALNAEKGYDISGFIDKRGISTLELFNNKPLKEGEIGFILPYEMQKGKAITFQGERYAILDVKEYFPYRTPSGNKQRWQYKMIQIPIQKKDSKIKKNDLNSNIQYVLSSIASYKDIPIGKEHWTLYKNYHKKEIAEKRYPQDFWKYCLTEGKLNDLQIRSMIQALDDIDDFDNAFLTYFKEENIEERIKQLKATLEKKNNPAVYMLKKGEIDEKEFADILKLQEYPKNLRRIIKENAPIGEKAKEFSGMFSGKKINYKKAGIVLASIAAIYIGFSPLLPESRPKYDQNIYKKIDFEDLSTESNRKQHITNINGLLQQIEFSANLKDEEGITKIKDIVENYFKTIDSQDKDFKKENPKLFEQYKGLKEKYNLLKDNKDKDNKKGD